jgi:hypothetical protein
VENALFPLPGGGRRENKKSLFRALDHGALKAETTPSSILQFIGLKDVA